MPSDSFVAALNGQVANEFAAHQQYVACAVFYDVETLPRLAAHFYAQALEERDHAMMMIQFLLDAGGGPPVTPGVAAPQTDFADLIAPVALALEQEKRVTEQINALAKLARDEGDYPSEQFLQWFIKEQVEEVSSMADLLTIVTRSSANPLQVEEYLARERTAHGADPTAPPIAGATA